KEACERYSPKIFFLNAGNVAAAKIKIDPAAAAGADLLAAAVAAANRFPQKNAVIVDFGTVTTITAVDKDGTFLGASFIPGMGIQSKSLGLASDNLFQIDVKAPQKILGTSTKSALESGVFFGTYGAVKYSTEKMIEEVFPEGAIIVGTGGYVKLFEDKGLLDYICPDMVIEGLLYWRGDL
ncbi:MAG: type III pantothenate kinase, partial [Holosporaceae bacterium]|nr:type III pantothenate kinase [Holosporaceae bacterium]